MADVVGGSVVWNLDVDNSKLQSGLDQAKSDVESAAKDISNSADGIKGALSRVGDVFKTGGLAATGFLATVGGLGTAMASVAGEFEQNRVAFETMIGNADLAHKTLSDLSDFAVRTPFELPQVITASKSLLAYGIDAKNLLPTLKTLGDISAGVGMDKLPQLILAFGQVRAASKLTGNELRQFTEAGVPLLEELSKVTGMSVKDMSGNIAKLSIPFEQVNQALNNLTGPGGRFFNLMDKQASTFGGTMSNIKDQVTRSLAEIAGVDIKQGGLIREGSLFAVMKEGADALLNVLNKATPVITKFLEPLLKNKDVLIAIAGAIGGALVLAVGALVVAFGPALLILGAFMVAGALLAVLIKKIIDILPTVTKFFSDLWTNISNGVTNAWNAVVNFFTVSIPQFIGNIITWLSELPKNIVKFIWNEIILGSIEFWAFMIGLAIYGVPKLIKTIIDFLVNLPAMIGNILNSVYTFFVNGWNGLINWATTNIPIFIDNIVNFIKTLPTRIGNAITDTKNNAVNGFKDMWNGLIREVSSWPSRMYDWGRNLVNSFVDGIKSALGQIVDAFKSGLNNAKKLIEGHSPPIMGPFKDIDKWGKNVASAWIEGFRTSFDKFSMDGFKAPTLAYSPIYNPSTLTSAQPTTSNGNGVTVNINEANIKNQQDVESLGREFGFRMGLVK